MREAKVKSILAMKKHFKRKRKIKNLDSELPLSFLPAGMLISARPLKRPRRNLTQDNTKPSKNQKTIVEAVKQIKGRLSGFFHYLFFPVIIIHFSIFIIFYNIKLLLSKGLRRDKISRYIVSAEPKLLEIGL